MALENDQDMTSKKLRINQISHIAHWNASLKATLTNLNQETAGYINGLDSYKDEDFSKRNFNTDAYRDAKSQRISLRLTRELKIHSFSLLLM